jgi:hypothetical protein
MSELLIRPETFTDRIGTRSMAGKSSRRIPTAAAIQRGRRNSR